MAFSDIIARLANLSFTQGVFPTKYKLAAVTPSLKKPSLDQDNPANYRPISNLINISKILERLFFARFQPHVCTCSNFSFFQSAYRRFHSTETALLHTLDKIFTSSDQGTPTILVSLDLSAAFDVIDHSILLNRLQYSFGISGTAFAWLQSYLSGRQQFVRAGHASSAHMVCSTGVPQGSVLGPILFSCYTSPICHLVSSFNMHIQQYADDTQVFLALKANNLTTQLAQFTACLSALHTWFTFNGLSLNSTKSEATLIGTHQRLRVFPPVPGATIAGSLVPLSDSIATLGVILDNNLSFSKHTSAVCKSVYFHIRALRHIRPALTDEMASILAASVVQSRLDYANSILYRSPAYNICRLQRAQNTLARVVLPKLSHFPTTSLLRQLHWLPVKMRIQHKLATLTFKTLSLGQPVYLRSLLHDYQPSRSLRSASQQLLTLPSFTSEFGRRSFSYCAPNIWNHLPLDIRICPSLNSFKHHLKTHFFNQTVH